MLASRRYNGSRSRKTKGSLADTLQCNIWRRAQTAHRLTHSLHGGNNHGSHNGFTALGEKIGTSKSTATDAAYVAEHWPLKYLRNKIAIICTTIAATGFLALGSLRRMESTISSMTVISDG